MRMTPEARATMRYLLRLEMPTDAYLDVQEDGTVNAQCATQDVVRRFRVAFGGGVVWRKEFVESCNWWEYNATIVVRYFIGLPLTFNVHIYAVREAPPTCKAIVETYETEESVPVTFEKRKVTKERVRWDCSGEGEVA